MRYRDAVRLRATAGSRARHRPDTSTCDNWVVTAPGSPASKCHPLSYDDAVVAFLCGEQELWWASVQERIERVDG